MGPCPPFRKERLASTVLKPQVFMRGQRPRAHRWCTTRKFRKTFISGITSILMWRPMPTSRPGSQPKSRQSRWCGGYAHSLHPAALVAFGGIGGAGWRRSCLDFPVRPRCGQEAMAVGVTSPASSHNCRNCCLSIAIGRVGLTGVRGNHLSATSAGADAA